jgi:HrpA-like RNA helicase
MSATLDTKLFGTFFHGSPIVNVPGRTFPVSTFYLEDVLEQTNHIIEEGSRYARRDNRRDRKTISMNVTSRGGEKRRETADYQMNEDVSDHFPGYKLATRK